MFHEIYYFNRFVINIGERSPARLSSEERTWLLMALKEECDEFQSSPTLEHDVDALVDLIYFAVGGLYRLGLSPDQAQNAFNAVHSANLLKKAGVKETRPQDGSVADATKPDDFIDPVHAIREMLND